MGSSKMTELSLLRWLETWYASLCNDDWEHTQNIMITTIDNPVV